MPPLRTHGDSRQRKWIVVIGQHWTQYEPFWEEFIYPMTFQEHEPGNYFLRPSLPDELIDLADTNYAVFFHLAQMHEWRHHAAQAPTRKGIGSTEALYCFFSHGWSLLDATRSFAVAVNATRARYGRAEAFEIDCDERGHVRDLCGEWGMQADRQRWEQLVDEIRSMRNFLVHTRPVFVQSRFIPKAEFLEAMSGLTAITKVARDNSLIRDRFVELVPALDGILERAAKALDGVWAHALATLREIDDARFERDRTELRRNDAKLTLEKILAARSLE